MSSVLTRALLMFALILSLGWAAGLSPSEVGAASIVVTTIDDTVDASKGCDTVLIGNLPGPDGEVSLREAICAANNTDGDDAITFEAGIGNTIALGGGELAITSNLTITGPGVGALTIDGNDSSRIFMIVNGTVQISDLTITGGWGEVFGGGIANSGALTLTRVMVSASEATLGGGIANFGSLIVSASTIVGNNAMFVGGGIFNMGQAQFADTMVSGNTAFSEGDTIGGGIASGFFSELQRGAIPAAPLAASLELTRVTVSDNAAIAGGGIALVDSPVQAAEVAPGATAINESTISGNVACVGGGILVDTAELAITNSTISDNHATASAGAQGFFDCSEGPLDGGGIATDGPLILTNSTVSGNSADNYGGGLYLRGSCICAVPVSITYATITGNVSDAAGEEYGGGGIYYDSFDDLAQTGAAPADVAEGVALNSSIVAGNLGPAGEEDCGGAINSAGHNLTGEGTGCPTNGTGDLTTADITAVLNTTLADNGGPTMTHALVAGSPALDAGDQTACAAIINNLDQRGVARLPLSCDIGAYEAALLTLTVQTEGTGTVAVSPTPEGSAGTADNTIYQYPPGTLVTLTAIPGNGFTLARWAIDGAGAPPYGKGWASPLTITLDQAHTARAVFIARPTFSDVPANHPSYGPISELGARAIAQGFTKDGCDAINTAVPCYGADNVTARAESALFLTRLLGLQDENHGNGGFSDIADQSPAAQQAIGTMAFYDIFQGYGDGRFGPNAPITHAELILVISRAMVHQGFWVRATLDDAAIYPNLTLGEQGRLDLVTFVRNAGNLPGFANTTPRAPVDQPAPRAWTAEALWQALNAHFGVDQPGKGGFVP